MTRFGIPGYRPEWLNGREAVLTAYGAQMDEATASGAEWRNKVRTRSTAEQDREAAALRYEEDRDPYDFWHYEQLSNPQKLSIDRAQRSRAGQHARHVRRLQKRHEHDGA